MMFNTEIGINKKVSWNLVVFLGGRVTGEPVTPEGSGSIHSRMRSRLSLMEK